MRNYFFLSFYAVIPCRFNPLARWQRIFRIEIPRENERKCRAITGIIGKSTLNALKTINIHVRRTHLESEFHTRRELLYRALRGNVALSMNITAFSEKRKTGEVTHPRKMTEHCECVLWANCPEAIVNVDRVFLAEGRHVEKGRMFIIIDYPNGFNKTYSSVTQSLISSWHKVKSHQTLFKQNIIDLVKTIARW